MALILAHQTPPIFLTRYTHPGSGVLCSISIMLSLSSSATLSARTSGRISICTIVRMLIEMLMRKTPFTSSPCSRASPVTSIKFISTLETPVTIIRFEMAVVMTSVKKTTLSGRRRQCSFVSYSHMAAICHSTLICRASLSPYPAQRQCPSRSSL